MNIEYATEFGISSWFERTILGDGGAKLLLDFLVGDLEVLSGLIVVLILPGLVLFIWANHANFSKNSRFS